MKSFKEFAFELKADDEQGTFEGWASVYGNVDSHNDIVMPGAFDKSIRESGGRVVILANHDPAKSIGLASLHDTPHGLRVRARLELELQDARDAYARLKAGLVSGLSIGYATLRESFKGSLRQLHEIKLYEVSLVTFPANDEARVDGVKADDIAEFDTFRELKESLEAERLSDEINAIFRRARARI